LGSKAHREHAHSYDVLRPKKLPPQTLGRHQTIFSRDGTLTIMRFLGAVRLKAEQLLPTSQQAYTWSHTIKPIFEQDAANGGEGSPGQTSRTSETLGGGTVACCHPSIRPHIFVFNECSSCYKLRTSAKASSRNRLRGGNLYTIFLRPESGQIQSLCYPKASWPGCVTDHLLRWWILQHHRLPVAREVRGLPSLVLASTRSRGKLGLSRGLGCSGSYPPRGARLPKGAHGRRSSRGLRKPRAGVEIRPIPGEDLNSPRRRRGRPPSIRLADPRGGGWGGGARSRERPSMRVCHDRGGSKEDNTREKSDEGGTRGASASPFSL